MKIQINEFTGIMPRVANDKLPQDMAQIAADVKTASGELRAYKRSTGDVALPGSSYKTFFEYFENDNRHWVYFDGVVFWARSPVADDTFERMYYMGESGESSQGLITFTDGMTDGETLTVGSQTFEFDIAEDGVGGGNTSLGDSTTITKELCAAALAASPPAAAVTFTDNLDGTVTVTATAHGTAGDAIVLTEVGAHITVDGAGTLGATNAGVDDGIFKAYANDINSAPWDFEEDFYTPGAPVGQAPTLAGYTGGGTEVRDYFYAFVSRYGEVGPGSTIAGVTDYTSGRMQVNDITYPDAADDHLITAVGTNYPKIRVYRTDSTATTSDFFEVCEAYWFDATQTYVAGDYVFYGGGGTYDLYECTVGGVGSWAGGTHTFVQGELVTVANLGSTPTSYLWNRCPDDLTNMRSHPNGFYVASKDNVLYFSEPFAPWAWPEDYQIPIDATIVGLGVFGSTIVVCTDGNIYTFAGPHPDSLYKQRLAFQPCLSQRAVVETDLGVMFPSKEGFQLVAADSSPQNVTATWFKPEDWDNFELTTLHGIWYNKSYYGFYSSSEYHGNIKIDFINNSVTTGADYHYATNVAIGDGVFRTIFPTEAGLETLYIATWDANVVSYRNYHYYSPRYILEKPANFKVAQVIIDTDFYDAILESIAGGSDLLTLNTAIWGTTAWGYQMNGPINDFIINDTDVNGDDLFSLSSYGIQDFVEFNIYVDGTLKFSKQITNSTMFKLPRGFKHKKWEIEVKGMIPVKRITLATSIEEIV